MKTFFGLFLLVTTSAFACDTGDSHQMIGWKAKPLQVAIETTWELPDTPPAVHEVFIVDVKSKKVVKRIAKGGLPKGFKAGAWPDFRAGEALSEGLTLKEELKPKGENSVERMLSLSHQGKVSTLNVGETSTSATEQARLERVYIDAQARKVLVLYHNCSDDIAVFTY